MISVTVDRGLLRAVDSYVEGHEGLDRSKVIDNALLAWYAARQAEATIEQYASTPTEDEDSLDTDPRGGCLRDAEPPSRRGLRYRRHDGLDGARSGL